MNTFEDVEEGISNADLIELESKLGFSLHQSLRDHLVKANGGSPQKYLFDNEGTIYVVSQFLSVKFGSARLLDNYKTIKSKLNENMAPFAIDSGGNYFCIDQDGGIYYFNTDYYDQPDKAIISICPDLGKFIQNMKSDDELA